jgi:hypothetical protein
MVDGKTRLGAEYFNLVWKDVDIRLDKLENKSVSWDTAVRELNAFGLERIDNVLAPLIASTNEILQNADDKVAELEVIISEATDSIDTQLQEHTAQVNNALQESTEQVNGALQEVLDTVSDALGGTVPVGAIIIWTGTACPAGWSRATELDGLFLKGAATAQNPSLTPSGSNTHTHTIDHSHTLPSHTHTMTHTHSVPAHTHSITNLGSISNSGVVYDSGSASIAWGTSGYKMHTHTGSTDNSSTLTTGGSSASTTGAWSGNTGAHSGSSSSSSNEPEHVTVLFCKKNAP